MLVLAHRGASAYAPENTEPAFRKAIELGADGVELDVHLCKDGHMVVNHNFDVDHNSDGLGLIEEYTLRELKQLDFGLWKGVEFKGTSILTLEEALEIVKNMKLINIEIKSAQTPYPGLTEKVCGLVRKMALTQKVILSSFWNVIILAFQPDFCTTSLFSTPPGMPIGKEPRRSIPTAPFSPKIRSASPRNWESRLMFGRWISLNGL